MLYDSAMSHSGIIFPKVLLGTSKLFTAKLLRIIFNTHKFGSVFSVLMKVALKPQEQLSLKLKLQKVPLPKLLCSEYSSE